MKRGMEDYWLHLTKDETKKHLFTLHAESFIDDCESPLGGFTDIPDTSLHYLEYVHAGVTASSILGRRPRYIE